MITYLVLSGLLCWGDLSAWGEGRWLDLTHSFNEEAIYWPTAGGFQLTTDSAGITDNGYYYAANSFNAAEHGGTHLDAPVHFAAGKHTSDEIPLSNLIAPGVVVDVTEKALKDPDFQVTTADLMAWEEKHGRLPDGCILLVYTGYDRFWPDRKRYMGTDERGPEAVPKLHFPGLHPEAASWLVTHRKIVAFGLDTPSIDYGQSKLFKTHRILFAENIPAFENVANLGSLPAVGALVVALPMKISGGSGGPLRIVAHVPK